MTTPISPTPLPYATVDPGTPPPHSELGRAACLIVIPGAIVYAVYCLVVVSDLRSPTADFVWSASEFIMLLSVLLGLTFAAAGLIVRRRRRMLPIVGLVLNLLLAAAILFGPMRLRQ